MLEWEARAEEDFKKIALARKEKEGKKRKVETTLITLNTDTLVKVYET